MNSKVGLTMVETVISISILLSAFLVVIALFHSGLNYTTRIQNQQLASMLTERTLEQIRAWSAASAGSGFNFDNLSIYQGDVLTPSDFPQFQITTSVSNQTLYSGCSSIELGMPTAPVNQQRVMQDSAKLVKVSVSWDQGSHSISVSSLIMAPPPDASAVSIVVTPTTPLPNPLSQDATVGFTAVAKDGAGQTIPDIMFFWDIAMTGTSGSGTLEQNRSGSACNFTNVVSLPNPAPPPPNLKFYTGGYVTVEARARINGVNVSGQAPQIVLHP